MREPYDNISDERLVVHGIPKVGGNVLVVRYIGAKDQERLFRTVHTVIAIALYGGVLLATAGWIISRPVLELMQPPPEVLQKATLYMRLYCVMLI